VGGPLPRFSLASSRGNAGPSQKGIHLREQRAQQVSDFFPFRKRQFLIHSSVPVFLWSLTDVFLEIVVKRGVQPDRLLAEVSDMVGRDTDISLSPGQEFDHLAVFAARHIEAKRLRLKGGGQGCVPLNCPRS
jgi:hypothetical protein